MHLKTQKYLKQIEELREEGSSIFLINLKRVVLESTWVYLYCLDIDEDKLHQNYTMKPLISTLQLNL